MSECQKRGYFGFLAGLDTMILIDAIKKGDAISTLIFFVLGMMMFILALKK